MLYFLVYSNSFFLAEHGAVHASYFNNIAKSNMNDLLSDVRYPNNPTYSGYLDNMETPPNYDKKYALRIWTYLEAPRSGEYVFYVCGDEFMQVSLSTDSSETNKRVIISSNGRTHRFQFEK